MNVHLRSTLDMLHKLSSTTNSENTIETANKIANSHSNGQRNEDCYVVDPEDGEVCGINCFLCQQLFTDIDELQHHLLIHFTECPENAVTKYFNCDVCGRSLRSEHELSKHHKRFHAAHMIKKDIESGNRFKCEQCSDIYISLEYLQKHVRSAHSATEKTTPELRPEPTMPELRPEPTMHIPPKLPKLRVVAAYPHMTQPKRKYPPRSPYFNPNLWMDCDAYI